MSQNYTSKNTSVNSTKLPSVYRKIDFPGLATCCGLMVFDYGCGKFNNAEQFLDKEYGAIWWGYDPYNRTKEENATAMVWFDHCDCIICSNVLNVIDDDSTIEKLCYDLFWTERPYFVTVYEGNRSGKGAVSKADCYQRNERVERYLKYFPENAVIRKGVITNCPEFIRG